MASTAEAEVHAFEDAVRNALHISSLEASKRHRFGKFEREDESPELELFRLYQSNELPLLDAPDADTLVVIGAPPQQSGQSDQAYAAIVHHFATFHKIHSGNLRSLGSPKFDELLGSTRQFRAERRLRNEGVLPGGKPSGIEYLLDLRPPSEGDEASFLLTDLSCSSGVLRWFKAQKKYGIPKAMVCGQDDSSLLPGPLSDPSPGRKQPRFLKKKKPSFTELLEQASPSQSSAEGGSKEGQEPKISRIGNWAGILPTAPVISDYANEDEVPGDGSCNVSSNQESSEESSNAAAKTATSQEPAVQPDYSQLRHRSAIERLLQVIEGNDPMLDSAPKMWTFYAIAKFFDCASNERVSGWIATWLFRGPNHNFIQCNPEVCYRIGLGIQSETLIKAAFSLLVGEKALMSVRRDREHYSVAGRKLECLDDDELNRVDHAANVFMRRIQAKYEALIGEDMVWLERSKLFGALVNFVPLSRWEEDVARRLKNDIKAFIRARVMWVLARDYSGDWPEMEQLHMSARPFYPHASSQSSIYITLGEGERTLTRFFWTALKEERFEEGDSSLFTPQPGNIPDLGTRVSPATGWSDLAHQLQLHDKTLECKLLDITKRELNGLAAWFKNILRERTEHPKAQTSRDWSDDEVYDWEHCAMKSKDYVRSETHTMRADGISAEASTLSGFESLQLSSPKRTHAIHSVTDLGDKKRARLDADDTRGESDQIGGKRAQLPIRTAAHQKQGPSAPVEEGKTNQIFRPPIAEDPEPPHHRLPCLDSEVYPNDDTAALSSKIKKRERGTGRSFRPKALHQALLEVVDDRSFCIDDLLSEVSRIVSGICDEVLSASHLFQDRDVPPTNLIGTLMCLSDAEWKYLPLWAGGNDDGSGGVFDDMEVPILEVGGFAGGKRGLGHDGNSSVAGSIDWSEIVSTVGRASKQAAAGTATETATVQSLGDVDMDVRSLEDDESSMQETETVVGLDASSVYNFDGDSDFEDDDHSEGDDEEDDTAPALRKDDDDHNEGDDKEDDTAPGIREDDFEETGWDDCNT